MFEDKIKKLLTKIPHSPETPNLTNKFLERVDEQIQFDISQGINAETAQNNISILLKELENLINQAADSQNSAVMLKQLEKSIIQILELKSVNEFTVNLANITELHFNYRIGDLIILPTKGDQLIVKDLMSRDIPKLYSTIEKVGNVVKITQGPRKLVGLFKNKILLFVPDNYASFLTVRSQSGKVTLIGLSSHCMLDLTNISGRVLLSNLKVKRFQADLKSSNLLMTNCFSQNWHINSQSGKIKAEAINCSNTEQAMLITTSSGSIDLTNITGQAIQINNKSGNLHLDQINSNTEITTNSGNIKFANIIKKTDIVTHSGNCKLSLNPKFQDTINVKSISGNIHLKLASESFPMRFNAETNLGRINLPMDTIIYASDNFNIMKGYLNQEDAPALAVLKSDVGHIDVTTLITKK